MRRFALFWIGLAMLLAGAAAHAGTPLAQLDSWSGRVNFTGAVASMRTSAAAPCAVRAAADVLTAELSGIPAGATILSARLYWAGSGSAVDDRVMFQAREVLANRTYTTSTDVAGINYFSAVADVTAQVLAKAADGKSGNGSYTFSGLAIESGGAYCTQAGVLGGFSLMVAYSHPSEQFRLMNLYEGFQFVRNSSVSLTMNSFKMPDKLNQASGQLGHITWAGDDGKGDKNEYVLFGAAQLANKANKSGDDFDSASSVSGQLSYGIDFDAYVVDNRNNEKPLVANATSVTTTYHTGDDRVLLSAEIIAVPTIQNVDLKITMARVGDLQVGVRATYKLTVANLGPNAEDGPITVTDTLPNGMIDPAASGSGWSCSTAGQTVTCSYPGPLASGASLPPITLTALVNAPGTYTNTAAVAGAEFDSAPGNNTASDTATTVAQGAYVFTDSACVAGEVVGTDKSKCNLYSKALFAGENGEIYVTAVKSGQVATPITASPQNISLSVGLVCEEPAANAGRAASYAGATLALCSPKGPAPAAADWKTVSLQMPANQPSAVTNFNYEDVGKVVLFLRDSAGNTASATIFVKPALLDFGNIVRTRGAVPNPGAKDGAGPGFAMAGEAFSLEIRACTAAQDSSGNPVCGKTLPNFGNEGQVVAIEQARGPDPAQPFQPPLGAGSFDAAVNGVVTGTGFHYDEVGVLKLTPALLGNSYLGQGDAKIRVQRTVGRFYPAYFKTAVQAPMTPCLKNMHCPSALSAAGDELMQGAVYSGQPFVVEVRAYNTAGTQLQNYANSWARPIQLSLVTNPGGATPLPAQSGTFAPVAQVKPEDIKPVTNVNASFKLPIGYSNAASPPVAVSGPTPFFVRASSTEAAGVRSELISSQRVAGSVEEGVTVINGRLQLANAFGSELLKLPVPMKAQYWTGTAWENNTIDTGASTIGYTASFGKCTRRLALDAAGTCAPALHVLGTTPVTLKDGTGTLWLAAPGNGNAGSGLLDLTGKGSPPWLPSTLARVTFGIYQSPLIYIRELY
jgi:uncharacterized repeat protein (TIGR01451 family)